MVESRLVKRNVKHAQGLGSRRRRHRPLSQSRRIFAYFHPHYTTESLARAALIQSFIPKCVVVLFILIFCQPNYIQVHVFYYCHYTYFLRFALNFLVIYYLHIKYCNIHGRFRQARN